MLKFKKQSGAASLNSRAKHELSWVSPKLNCVFYITKHNICCSCFKQMDSKYDKETESKCLVHLKDERSN